MGHDARKNFYGIGAISQETGVKIETIRYYERIGLLPEPRRTSGGDRQYRDEDASRISFIKRCRDLDFGLDEIRALLDIIDSGSYSCSDVHSIAMAHLEDLRERIGELQHMADTLASVTDVCKGDQNPDCPIVDMLPYVPHKDPSLLYICMTFLLGATANVIAWTG